MKRRQFLKTTAVASLSALASHNAASQMMRMPGGMGSAAGPSFTSLSSWPMGLPLRPIEVLANTSDMAGEFAATLTAAPYRASIVSGVATELWGYNNAYPGPVIELWEGQRVSIEFANRLGLDSTIHWHGLPVPPDQDGSPMDPVAPQSDRIYAFDVPAGTAGTYWYHPHAHRTVTLQAGHGLVAPLIVRSDDDPLDALPELTLMVSSLALDRSGQVAAPLPMGGMGAMGGMMMSGGGVLLVNGQRVPVHATSPGATERWRVINATADRYLRIALDGHRFAVVGTDGGLLGQPLTGLTEWLLAPAQRVEIVVTLASQSSARYVLRDLGYGAGMSVGAGAELMTVALGSAPAAQPVEIPSVLRPVADLGIASIRQRVVLSSLGMGMMGPFLINGRTFDMNRIDLETVVNRVELWDLVNATFMDHPIHIHGTQFQVVTTTVGGVPRTVPYAAWLDTVNVPAGETVTIKVRQALPGKRMVHCHILPHEDAGMMAVLDVKPT